MVGHAGVRLLADLADGTGLTAACSAALRPLRPRGSGHDPGRIATDLAVMLAYGGEAISDPAVLRDQVLGRRIGEPWQALTPQPDWKIVHFFGYDNSFCHAVLRYFLSSTRPEGMRTDFTRAAHEAALHDLLIGTWQKWLTDLGERVDERSDGTAPAAGNWTPEHTVFLGRSGARLTALTGSLSPGGFSLRQAATELDGIIQTWCA